MKTLRKCNMTPIDGALVFVWQNPGMKANVNSTVKQRFRVRLSNLYISSKLTVLNGVLKGGGVILTQFWSRN